MKYYFVLIIIFTACRNKSPDVSIKNRLSEAILKKDTDSIAFSKFKTENATNFKTFDSLKKTNQITTEQQNNYDSLMQLGVNLSMKFVKDQMQINDLKKKLE
jgi:hypothetical protein